VASRKGRRSLKATSWPDIMPRPACTAGLRLSVGSAAASLVPSTPSQTDRLCHLHKVCARFCSRTRPWQAGSAKAPLPASAEPCTSDSWRSSTCSCALCSQHAWTDMRALCIRSEQASLCKDLCTAGSASLNILLPPNPVCLQASTLASTAATLLAQ